MQKQVQVTNEIDGSVKQLESEKDATTQISYNLRRNSVNMNNINNNVNSNINSVVWSPRLTADLISASSSSSEKMSTTTTNSASDAAISESEGDRNHLRRRNFSHEPGMTRRCVCNLSQCASSNYMCKSERRILEDGRESDAGCFIEELLGNTASGSETGTGSQHGVKVGVTESNGRVTSARRGCIEMLSREKQDMCSDHTGAPVQCCFKDMCNYPKTYYPPFTQNVNNNRLAFDSTAGRVQGVTPNLDHQVWLRAAVIAVPVCGLMILIVLIIVARRLLKSDDLDYKESNGSGMSRSNRNKAYNYPGPHPPHQHVKPVFLEPQEFLLPIDNHCCCHNNSSSSTEYPIAVSGGFPTNPSTNSGETEELVNSIGQLSHCQCPSNLSDTSSYCSSNRPPSLLQYPPPMAHPRKFNILSHLGLSRTSKDTNLNSNNSRPYDV